MTLNKWPELAQTLQTRRNLEAALVPSEKIGCKDFPRHGESQKAFETRRNQSRKSHAKWSADIKRLHSTRTRTAVEKKISELKKKERELWWELRPDLENTTFHNES